MNKLSKRLSLTVLAGFLLVGCGAEEFPSIQPGEDQKIEEALKDEKFSDYRIQGKHKATADYEKHQTVAYITPAQEAYDVYIESAFGLFGSDYLEQYRFRKNANGNIDVYYKNKTTLNEHELGYSLYENYKKDHEINALFPSEQEYLFHFGKFDMSMLEPEWFTYDVSSFGYYDLNEDQYQLILTSFFKLAPDDYEIEKFRLRIADNNIYMFDYALSAQSTTLVDLSNQFYYRFNEPPLTAPDDSVFVKNVNYLEVLEPVEETENEENPAETPEEENETNPAINYNVGLLNLPPGLYLNFTINDDATNFLGAKAAYTIDEINLYAGYAFDFAETALLEQLKPIQDGVLVARHFPLDSPLTPGNRYTIRVYLHETADKTPDVEYYEYSFIAEGMA